MKPDPKTDMMSVWHASCILWSVPALHYTCALVPDDKMKKFMWKVPRLTYQCLLFHFAMCSPSWERTHLTVEEANKWCLRVLSELLPPSVKKFLALGRYRHVLLYCYGTIKSKCLACRQHVCKKLNHSCLRKVVSFAGWPGRKRWRTIHRGQPWHALRIRDVPISSNEPHAVTCNKYFVKQ